MNNATIEKIIWFLFQVNVVLFKKITNQLSIEFIDSNIHIAHISISISIYIDLSIYLFLYLFFYLFISVSIYLRTHSFITNMTSFILVV